MTYCGIISVVSVAIIFVYTCYYPLAPVSYTHLDVYKRQEVYAAQRQTCRKTIILSINNLSRILYGVVII